MLAILERRPAASAPGAPDRERVWLGRTYLHVYRRVENRWLISALACDISLEAPFPQ
jgi:hypothetical protein